MLLMSEENLFRICPRGRPKKAIGEPTTRAYAFLWRVVDALSATRKNNIARIAPRTITTAVRATKTLKYEAEP